MMKYLHFDEHLEKLLHNAKKWDNNKKNYP